MIRRPPRSTLFPTRRSSDLVGSGPIRIGQGIEFDYCSVHAAWALRAAGVRAIMANSNPETVSTDFDTSEDRKSTRLNSSHLVISYAVFCLKKKNNIRHRASH